MGRLYHESLSTRQSMERQLHRCSLHKEMESCISCWTIREMRGPMWEVGHRRELKRSRSPVTQRKSSENHSQAHPLVAWPLPASLLILYIFSPCPPHSIHFKWPQCFMFFLSAGRRHPCQLHLDYFPLLFSQLQIVMVLFVSFLLASSLELSRWDKYASFMLHTPKVVPLYKMCSFHWRQWLIFSSDLLKKETLSSVPSSGSSCWVHAEGSSDTRKHLGL